MHLQQFCLNAKKLILILLLLINIQTVESTSDYELSEIDYENNYRYLSINFDEYLNLYFVVFIFENKVNFQYGSNFEELETLFIEKSNIIENIDLGRDIIEVHGNRFINVTTVSFLLQIFNTSTGNTTITRFNYNINEKFTSIEQVNIKGNYKITFEYFPKKMVFLSIPNSFTFVWINNQLLFLNFGITIQNVINDGTLLLVGINQSRENTFEHEVQLFRIYIDNNTIEIIPIELNNKLIYLFSSINTNYGLNYIYNNNTGYDLVLTSYFIKELYVQKTAYYKEFNILKDQAFINFNTINEKYLLSGYTNTSLEYSNIIYVLLINKTDIIFYKEIVVAGYNFIIDQKLLQDNTVLIYILSINNQKSTLFIYTFSIEKQFNYIFIITSIVIIIIIIIISKLGFFRSMKNYFLDKRIKDST
ncbi:MAG: hypothetical protein OEY49_10620 [Candidatus Heimdallarchaeota archaeon]|nr:hypothetical protein [Candidatus Heimdallarchaeota archaeon]